MATRFVEETESGKDGSATEPVITAGVNRSGKKRLSPLADSETSETPTAESREDNLLGNQPVRTASPPVNSLTDLLPAPAGMSASNDEREGSQVAGGSNNSQQTEEVHSDQARDSVTSGSDLDSERSGIENTSKMGDTEKDEVVLVEESPTQYDGNRLPRTIEAGRFTGVVTHTHTIRTQIVKCLKNMDKAIAQLIQLENEGEGDSDGEDFIDGLYKEIKSENNEVKSKLKKHEDLTNSHYVPIYSKFPFYFT